MNNRTITKREILFSIVIIAIMLVFGFMISSGISNSLMNDYQEYNTALQIDNNKDVFQHGMRTNIGNAFVYGELKAVDTVTYDDVKGEYSYIQKVTEKYTEHVDVVTHTYTDADGNTQTYTTTEYSYSWDVKSRESKHSEKITFLDTEFAYGTIPFPSDYKIATVYEKDNMFNRVGDLRFVYYAAPAKSDGTLYAVLKDKTISNVHFYHNTNIEDTIDNLESEWQIPVFWVFWVLFTGGLVVGFYFIDNKWLEDKKR